MRTSVGPADLTDAIIKGGYFSVGDSSLSATLLYSTASYKARDLRGTTLFGPPTGWDLTGQDMRHCQVPFIVGDPFLGAIVKNMISPTGHVGGLDLIAGETELVRDDDAFRDIAPMPIIVDQHFTLQSGGTIQFFFDSDAWDSTISFAAGIPVQLGGETLNLTFAEGVDPSSQRGRTFDLFNWTGVAPTGALQVVSP